MYEVIEERLVYVYVSMSLLVCLVAKIGESNILVKVDPDYEVDHNNYK